MKPQKTDSILVSFITKSFEMQVLKNILIGFLLLTVVATGAFALPMDRTCNPASHHAVTFTPSAGQAMARMPTSFHKVGKGKTSGHAHQVKICQNCPQCFSATFEAIPDFYSPISAYAKYRPATTFALSGKLVPPHFIPPKTEL